MTQQLNKPEEVYQRYKSFLGSNLEQMPLLLSGKDEQGKQTDVPRIPVYTAQLARLREERGNEFPDWFEYREVSDLIAYDRKDRSSNVQVILTVDNQNQITELGKRVLALYQPNAQLTEDRAIDLTQDDLYSMFKGQEGVIEMPRDELTTEVLQEILLRHPKYFSGKNQKFAEDENFPKEHIKWLKKQTGRTDVMNAYLNKNTNKAKLQAFYVGRADPNYRSSVYGRYFVDDTNGCLAGLAPEVPDVSVINLSTNGIITPSLEQVLTLADNHISPSGRNAFEKAVRTLYSQ